MNALYPRRRKLITMRLLIADDELIECRYLKEVFAAYPQEFEIVGVAQNGKDVLELSKVIHPDVVIMDINLPEMNGLEAAKEIKSVWNDVIVIVNTAYADFEYAQTAVNYHMDAYLLKPASRDEIISVVRTQYAKRCQKYATHSGNRETSHEETQEEENLIYQVKKYVQTYFYQGITLADVSEAVHFSPSYISKVFHARTGNTYRNYLTDVRVEHAQYLLQYTNRSIRQIALDSGFTNVSHFYRVFKAKTKSTPAQFRKLTREESRQ